MDYYRSPSQSIVWEEQTAPNTAGTMPPTGAGRPSRRKGGLVFLVLFLALILALAVALALARFLPSELWRFSLDAFFKPDPGFSFELPPEEFAQAPEATWSPGGGSFTTIPRADPDPEAEMLLAGPSEQELSFQEIYEKVVPAIVSVQSYDDYGAYEGTGVIMTADGYIITNHHIIAGCSAAEVVLSDSTRYEARLVGSDAESDLAVLKVEAASLTPAEFGDSDRLRVGDTALAIGNPLGSGLFGTMTEGIVSALNRDVSVEGYTMSLIQTTAALNPGNSGGALINSAGQVVGITNMKMMSDYETIEGLGFAIPTAWAKEVVDTLLAQGNITGRPTIGITCVALQSGDEAYYGRDSGVYVDSVTPGGPADLAGLRPGDVITQANGRSITSLDELTVVRDEAGVGGVLELTVWRGGEELELSLTLADQYELN